MRCTDRFYPTKKDFRDPFYRDRDRVIHSLSFRRLEYKTQVFINYVGDNFRTRLTHSLEVAQIARAICGELKLNEGLAEAIALAHDIGHTPFGHVGGDELNRLIKERFSPYGFDHNFQSFRVVTSLEKRYKEFDGLNLTFATLEGILKHSFPYKKPFLGKWYDEIFDLSTHPSLEAMVVDKADEIAYLSADIEDGVGYGLISFEDILESKLVREVVEKVEKMGYQRGEKLFRYRFSSTFIDTLVSSLITNSSNPAPNKILCKSLNANQPSPISHTPFIQQELKNLKALLFEKLYYHPNIMRKMHAGKKCIQGLFNAFVEEPRLMSKEFYQRTQREKVYRVVADFIASMSDRYAMKLYREIYGIEV